MDTVRASVIVAGICGVGLVTSSDHPVVKTTINRRAIFIVEFKVAVLSTKLHNLLLLNKKFLFIPAT